MSRGINDPAPEELAEEGQFSSEATEIIYEMQQVIQELIMRHNELANKVDKLDDKLTDARIQFEAQKLVWNKGL